MDVDVPPTEKAVGLRTPLEESAPTPDAEGDGVKEGFVEGALRSGNCEDNLVASLPSR